MEKHAELAASAATGQETIHFREGDGTGYTVTTFDDTYINSFSQASC